MLLKGVNDEHVLRRGHKVSDGDIINDDEVKHVKHWNGNKEPVVILGAQTISYSTCWRGEESQEKLWVWREQKLGETQYGNTVMK